MRLAGLGVAVLGLLHLGPAAGVLGLLVVALAAGVGLIVLGVVVLLLLVVLRKVFVRLEVDVQMGQHFAHALGEAGLVIGQPLEAGEVLHDLRAEQRAP